MLVPVDGLMSNMVNNKVYKIHRSLSSVFLYIQERVLTEFIKYVHCISLLLD